MNEEYNKINKILNFFKNYSKSLENFGYVLIQFNLIISTIFFWFLVFIYYEPYREVTIVIFSFFRVAIFIFAIGFLVHYVCIFLKELNNKKLKKNIKVRVNYGKLSK